MKTFESNIISLYGDKGKTWLTTLPVLANEYATKWNLSDLRPVNNLSFNYVLSGVQGTQPVILKLVLDVKGLEREVSALMAFEGYGAVRVLEAEEGAVLLERALPGQSLKVYHGNLSKIEIACKVTKKLHQAPLPEAPFPHVRERLKALDHPPKGIPPKHRENYLAYLEKARTLKDALLKNSSDLDLLHGDLHPENILQQEDTWVVIDPKGVIGAPIHEVWAFIEDFERDSQYVAEFFDFDLMEVRAWYFVHLTLALTWSIEDGTSLQPFLGIAEKVHPSIPSLNS